MTSTSEVAGKTQDQVSWTLLAAAHTVCRTRICWSFTKIEEDFKSLLARLNIVEITDLKDMQRDQLLRLCVRSRKTKYKHLNKYHDNAQSSNKRGTEQKRIKYRPERQISNISIYQDRWDGNSAWSDLWAFDKTFNRQREYTGERRVTPAEQHNIAPKHNRTRAWHVQDYICSQDEMIMPWWIDLHRSIRGYKNSFPF